MKIIRCRKAKALLDRREDGLLSPKEEKDLSAHLRGCPLCQKYASENAALEALLTRSTPVPPADFSEWVMNAVTTDAVAVKTDEALLRPRYRRPVSHVLITASLIIVIGVGLAVSHSLGTAEQDGASADMDNSHTSGIQDNSNGFYIQDDGMNTSYPWMHLMVPDQGDSQAPEGDRTDENNKEEIPSDAEELPLEPLPPEGESETVGDSAENEPPMMQEPEADGGGYGAEETIYRGPYPMTGGFLSGNMGNIEVETEGRVPSDAGHFLVLTGESTTLLLSVQDDGDALWQGKNSEGLTVTFLCREDGTYRLSLQNRTVSQGRFCGYKGEYLLLEDSQSGKIALRFSMKGDNLKLEVADIWKA